MKIVIFAGGLGSRLGSMTQDNPKPLLKIQKEPLIKYLLDIFIKQNFNDFLILTGYKSKKIEEYFKKNKKKYSNCKIKIFNTGVNTCTGKRLKLAKKYLPEMFILSYSDGLANIDLNKLINFHIKKKKLVTVTAVRPPARFGELFVLGNKVIEFKEKQQMKRGWINGGFFVVYKKFLSLIPNKDIMFEREPIYNATKKGQLCAYKHRDFWQCVDTIRDYEILNDLVKKKNFMWLNF
jgi:glucose-1-phosphate cytidylyltransferase